MTQQLVTLKQACSSCVKCDLYKSRTQVVFGTGPVPCDVMLVELCPGEEEDYEGVPFSGRRGKRLNKALIKAGTKKKNLYLTSMVKCLPSLLESPTEQEIATCFAWLRREIAIVKPKTIITFGETLLHAFLGKEFSSIETYGQGFEDSNTGLIIYPMLGLKSLVGDLNNIELQERFDDAMKEALS